MYLWVCLLTLHSCNVSLNILKNRRYLNRFITRGVTLSLPQFINHLDIFGFTWGLLYFTPKVSYKIYLMLFYHDIFRQIHTTFNLFTDILYNDMYISYLDSKMKRTLISSEFWVENCVSSWWLTNQTSTFDIIKSNQNTSVYCFFAFRHFYMFRNSRGI